MLFDSWAGILSPAQFRAHVIEPTQAIVAALRQRASRPCRSSAFPRLAGLLVGDYAAATRVDGVGLDTSMDLGACRGVRCRRAWRLQGNLDPLALVAGGAALRRETAAILAALRGRPCIFNLGHGIVPQTPPEHVAALVEQVRAA